MYLNLESYTLEIVIQNPLEEHQVPGLWMQREQPELVQPARLGGIGLGFRLLWTRSRVYHKLRADREYRNLSKKAWVVIRVPNLNPIILWL